MKKLYNATFKTNCVNYFLCNRDDETLWLPEFEVMKPGVEVIKCTPAEWDEIFDRCPFEVNSLPFTIEYVPLSTKYLGDACGSCSHI